MTVIYDPLKDGNRESAQQPTAPGIYDITREIMGLNPETASMEQMVGLSSYWIENYAGVRDDTGRTVFGKAMEPQELIRQIQKLHNQKLHPDLDTDFDKLVKMDREGQMKDAVDKSPVSSRVTQFATTVAESDALKADTWTVDNFTQALSKFFSGELRTDKEKVKKLKTVADDAMLKKHRNETFQKDFFKYKTLLESGMGDDSKAFAQEVVETGKWDTDKFAALPEEDKPNVPRLAFLLRATDNGNVVEESAMRLAHGTWRLGKGTMQYISTKMAEGVAGTAGFFGDEGGQVLLALDEIKKERAYKEMANRLKYEERGFVGKGATGMAESLPYMLALAYGGPVGMLTATAAKANEFENELLEMGVDPEVAPFIGGAVGVLNTAIERMPGGLFEAQASRVLIVEALSKGMLKKAFVDSLKNAVSVGSTEMIEEVLQGLADEAGRQIGMSDFDLERFTDTVVETLRESLPTIVGFGLLSEVKIQSRGAYDHMNPSQYDKMRAQIDEFEKRFNEVMPEGDQTREDYNLAFKRWQAADENTREQLLKEMGAVDPAEANKIFEEELELRETMVEQLKTMEDKETFELMQELGMPVIPAQEVTPEQLAERAENIRTKVTEMGYDGVLEVVETTDDLPDGVMPTDTRNAFVPATDIVEGLADVGGMRGWIVARNIGNMTRAEQVIMHESVGHLGPRAAFGDARWNQILDQFVSDDGMLPVIKAVGAAAGHDITTQDGLRKSAEELLSQAVEKMDIEVGTLKRAYAKVRQLLRDWGLVGRWTDNDVAALLNQSRAAIQARSEKEATRRTDQSDRVSSAEAASADQQPADAAGTDQDTITSRTDQEVRYSLTRSLHRYAQEVTGLSETSAAVTGFIERWAALDTKIKAALKESAAGHSRPNSFEISRVLTENPDLMAEAVAIQEEAGVEIVNEAGLIMAPIEARPNPKDPTKPQFGGFAQTLAQAYLQKVGEEEFEAWRSDYVRAQQDAFDKGKEVGDSPVIVTDPETAQQERIPIKKLRERTPAQTGAQDEQFRIPGVLKGADKTLAALNLSSACPMFMVGGNGCYFDGCYVTGMGMGGNTINYYQKGAYLGEILALSDEVIEELNAVGGLRVNGQGDTDISHLPQWRDILAHAKERGLKMKIITKQESVLEILETLNAEGADISGVMVQPTVDPYWTPVTEDAVPGSGAETQGLARDVADPAVQQEIIKQYKEQFGREAQVIDGQVYRKWGFSFNQIDEMRKKYPTVQMRPRIVVGSPMEIAETALNHPEVIQTWMHASIRPGLYSDIEGRVFSKKGDIGNYTARISVSKVDGQWRIQAQGAKGTDEVVDRKAYDAVEKYIKDSYSEADAEKIFKTLAGQLEDTPSALCCAAGANPDACNDCTSHCHDHQSVADEDWNYTTTATVTEDQVQPDIRASLAQTNTPEFKKWFGKSKVVDADGNPLVVYHGSPEKITTFDKGKRGASTKAPSAKQGFFFTSLSEVATDFARFAARRVTDQVHTLGTYLSIQNPKVIQGRGDTSLADEIRAAKKAGHDGLIAKNILDDANMVDDIFVDGERLFLNPNDSIFELMETQSGAELSVSIDGIVAWFEQVIEEEPDYYPQSDLDPYLRLQEAFRDNPSRVKLDTAGRRSDVYVVFEPNQIKSATDNVGTFDAADPDIRHSLAQKQDPARMAAVNIAMQIYKGQYPEPEQVLKQLDEVGLVDQVEPIMAKAVAIVNDLKDTVRTAAYDKEILGEIRQAEIRQHYQQQVKDVFDKGLQEGEVAGQAKEVMAQRRAAAKATEVRGRTGINPRELPIDVVYRIDAEDFDPIALVVDIEEQIRQKLVAEGRFTDKKTKLANDRIYRRELQMTLAKALREAAHKLTYALNRERLIRRIDQLAALTSTGRVPKLKTIQDQARRIAEDINKGRVKDDINALREEWKKVLDTPKVKKPGKMQPLHKQDMAIKVKRWIGIVRNVAGIGRDTHRALIEKLVDYINLAPADEAKHVTSMFAELYEKYPALKKYKHLDKQDQALLLVSAAYRYGALKTRNKAELRDMIDSIQKDIDGGVRLVEQAVEERRNEVEPIREVLRDAIAPSGVKPVQGVREKAEALLRTAYGARSWFGVLAKGSTGELNKAAERHLSTILERINQASQTEDIGLMNAHNRLFEAIQEIYGEDPGQVIKRLKKRSKKLGEKYSNFERDLSILDVMKLYGDALQEDYQDNAKKHNRDAVDLKKALTEKELALLNWFHKDYADQRPLLSALNEEIIGVPIEMADPNYLPGFLKRSGGMREIHIGANVVPKSMTPRTEHRLDFAEDVDILDIWVQRTGENEHYKAWAKTALLLRGVFGEANVQDSIEKALGKKSLNMFLDMISDNINGGYSEAQRQETIDAMRGMFTMSKFFFNMRIGAKQVTSIPAFGFEIPLRHVPKYMVTAFTPGGVDAMFEIARSEQAKERFGRGHTEELQNALKSMTPSRLAKFIRSSMIFNKLGDMTPTLLVGQGIYRSYVHEYNQTGMPMEEAKEKAMSKLWEIVQATQQSGKLKDQSYWQRRWGTMGALAATFTNTTRQFLEQELKSFERVMAQPKDTQRWKDLASKVFINHVMLPGLYNGVNIIINMLMGDEPDEDDLALLAASMLAGPASGFIIFGAIITAMLKGLTTGDLGYGNQLTPFSGVLDDGQTAMAAGHAIWDADEEKFMKAIDKLLKSYLPPYREVRKVQAN